MNQHRIRLLTGLVLAAAALAVLPWIGDGISAQGRPATAQQGRTKTVTDAAGRKHTRIIKVTQAEREAAANRIRAKILKGTTDPTLATGS